LHTQVSSFIGVLADIGAEKEIMVSKIGFQSGAHRLATFTNIELLTYDELRQKSVFFIDRFKIHNAFDRIQTLKVPFTRFFWSMKDEAEKMDEWWYPSTEGSNLLGALGMLQDRIELIDPSFFPRNYHFSFISQTEEEISKTAHNRKEYLDLILENLAILEKEYKESKDRIFSELGYVNENVCCVLLQLVSRDPEICVEQLYCAFPLVDCSRSSHRGIIQEIHEDQVCRQIVLPQQV